MLDLLAAAVALTVVVAGAAAAALGLLVAPFVAACDAAERRGGSPARAGAVALAAGAVALGGALVVLRGDLPAVLAALPLALPWAAVAVVGLLPDDPALLGGRGRHEHGASDRDEDSPREPAGPA